MITGQGLLIMLAGYIESATGNVPMAWAITFYVLAGLFILLAVYHGLVLPKPAGDAQQVHEKLSDVLREFSDTFASFFKKERIGVILAFLLLFRFAEAQLAKMASPFLLDGSELGGLGLTTGEVGFVYGTVGILMLTLGGPAWPEILAVVDGARNQPAQCRVYFPVLRAAPKPLAGQCGRWR